MEKHMSLQLATKVAVSLPVDKIIRLLYTLPIILK